MSNPLHDMVLDPEWPYDDDLDDDDWDDDYWDHDPLDETYDEIDMADQDSKDDQLRDLWNRFALHQRAKEKAKSAYHHETSTANDIADALDLAWHDGLIPDTFAVVRDGKCVVFQSDPKWTATVYPLIEIPASKECGNGIILPPDGLLGLP